MRLILGRVVSALITASGWTLFGIRLVLDLIGYSTVPEDAEIAASLLERFLAWVLSVPWWATLGFALVATVATMLLTWVSWPRHALMKTENSVNDKSALPQNWQPQILIENINIDSRGGTFREEAEKHSETAQTKAYVHWRPNEFEITESFNILSVTDNGHGDFTFTFDSPLNANTLVVLPIGATPPFSVEEISQDSVRVRFNKEPEIIKLRFDAV